jgi:hypothetical protein
MHPMSAAKDFVSEQCDFDGALAADDDIFRRVGITGDDAGDFIEAFAARFGVDMSGYRWYFHTEEEGFNIGGALFPSPETRVTRIPVTLRVLAEALTRKTWPVTYPEHEAPRGRPDRVVNQLVFAAVLAAFALLLCQRLAG